MLGHVHKYIDIYIHTTHISSIYILTHTPTHLIYIYIHNQNALDVDLLVRLLVLGHVHRLQVRVGDQPGLEGLEALFIYLFMCV